MSNSINTLLRNKANNKIYYPITKGENIIQDKDHRLVTDKQTTSWDKLKETKYDKTGGLISGDIYFNANTGIKSSSNNDILIEKDKYIQLGNTQKEINVSSALKIDSNSYIALDEDAYISSSSNDGAGTLLQYRSGVLHVGASSKELQLDCTLARINSGMILTQYNYKYYIGDTYVKSSGNANGKPMSGSFYVDNGYKLIAPAYDNDNNREENTETKLIDVHYNYNSSYTASRYPNSLTIGDSNLDLYMHGKSINLSGGAIKYENIGEVIRTVYNGSGSPGEIIIGNYDSDNSPSLTLAGSSVNAKDLSISDHLALGKDAYISSATNDGAGTILQYRSGVLHVGASSKELQLDCTLARINSGMILTQYNYKSYIGDTYIKSSGGTISGTIYGNCSGPVIRTVNHGSGPGEIIIGNYDSATAPSLTLTGSSVNAKYLTITDLGHLALDGDACIYSGSDNVSLLQYSSGVLHVGASNKKVRLNCTEASVNGHKILTEDNYTDCIGDTYIKSSGGTLTGTLYGNCAGAVIRTLYHGPGNPGEIIIGNYDSDNSPSLTLTGRSVTARELSVTGSKNCVQHTESYGDILFYSTEDAESLLTWTNKLKSCNTGKSKEIKVEIDPMFKESVDLENDYIVDIYKISFGDYRIKEKSKDYFVLESSVDNFEFQFSIKAHRKGYETAYMDKFNKPSSIE